MNDGPSRSFKPVVVVLLWGQVVEDWLDPYGLGVDDLLRSMTDGWLFGYIDALATAGVSTVPVLITREVAKPQRRSHAPTGTNFWLLPATNAWRVLRRLVDDPYAPRAIDAAKGRSMPRRLVGVGAHTILPWVSTPIRQLVRTIREERATVVLCQDYEYPTFDICVALSPLLGASIHAVFQGATLPRTSLERLTRPFAVWGAAGLVIASSTEVDRVQGVYGIPDRCISMIPNPVSLDDWIAGDREAARASLGIPADAGVASYHGRIEFWHKGLDILLDAWQEVTAQRPERELILLITGSGRDSDALRAEIERRRPRGIHWCDEFVLNREFLQQRLAAADLAVLSSRVEGFAVAPLEAMACGRAVVAADISGIPDLAPNRERDGVVRVTPGSADELATAIGGLLDDSERAATVGAAARQRIEAYSPKAVGAALATALRLRDEPPSGENALQRSYRHRVDAWRSYTTARRLRKTESVRREALTKVALRAGRFLGISDLAHSIAEAHTRLDAQQKQLDALRGEHEREAGRR